MARNRIFDSDSQRQKVYQYCKNNNLDYEDDDYKEAVREYFRYREGYYNDDGYFHTSVLDIPEKKGKIVRKTPRSIFDLLSPDLPKNKLKKLELAFRGEFGLRQLTPDGEFRPYDPTIKPEPTGFVSDLSDEEWIVRYIPKAIFGSLYKTQKTILKFMRRHPRCLIEVFRSAGKTIISNAKIVRTICDNPNVRAFILSEEYSKVVQRMRMIRNLLLAPEIVADYGYLLNDNRTSRVKGKNTEVVIECHRQIETIEPTLMGITWKDTKSLGFHYDFGLIDDPWSNDAQRQANALDKFKSFWGEFQGSLETCKQLYVICTRKGVDDVYQWMRDELGIFDVLTIPLVRKFPHTIEIIKNEFGKSIGAKVEGEYELSDDCKGKYSMTKEDPDKGIKCIPIMRKGNPYHFEMEYQQRPYLPEGDVFKWENVSLYGPSSRVPIEQDFMRMFDRAHKVLIMDMAYGQSKDADYNALLLVCKYKAHYFLVDAWVGQAWSFNKRLSYIRRAKEKYPDATLYIESDFWQLSMIEQIRSYFPQTRKFKSAGKGMKFADLYSGFGSKSGKFGKIHDGLESVINNGLLHIRETLPHLDKIQLQITRFPKLNKIDFLDALAMACIILRKRGTNAFERISMVSKTMRDNWLS